VLVLILFRLLRRLCAGPETVAAPPWHIRGPLLGWFRPCGARHALRLAREPHRLVCLARALAESRRRSSSRANSIDVVQAICEGCWRALHDRGCIMT